MNIKGINSFRLILMILISSVLLISCGTTKAVQEASDNRVAIEDFNITDFEVITTEKQTGIDVITVCPEIYGDQEERQREDEKVAASLTPEQKKFYLLKRTRDYEVVGEDLDYKIMVNHDTKEVIIQYEESDSDQDWHNNYLFLPWPLKLDNKIIWTTYGFAKIYKSSKNIPLEKFMKEIEAHPDYKIVIWGWSLGSAMAKITARHLIIRTKKQVKIDELTTYGDVKCWYNPFYSLKKHCEIIHEYVTPNDAVTWCVPICRRDVKSQVGEKFRFKKEENSEYYHTHYEEYDYSEFEK